MGVMPGSRCCDHLISKLADDPDQLRTESAADLYERLFADARNRAGYILQGRIMKLHELVTNQPELSSEEILASVQNVSRESAIADLIRLHNAGIIKLSKQRFEPFT